jgi:hypothetical protein
MLEYVAKLRKETDDAIDRIESSDNNILKKSLYASHILADAFDKLKKFILSYESSYLCLSLVGAFIVFSYRNQHKYFFA